MKHTMHLDSIPFEEMENGSKIVEIRLYDTKRRKIKVGDIIHFVNRSNIQEAIDVEVISLQRFSALSEIVKKYSRKLGSTLPTYPLKEQEKYGFLAIGVKL